VRIKALLLGDIRFQIRYGFYFVYLVFTVLYVSLLSVFPASWREPAAVLMIFSDPAAMGLYFMGALILFEKSQRVLDSVAVSPVKPMEYVLAKLASLAVISAAVGFLIGVCGGAVGNPFWFFFGVFLGSCLFSAVGLLIALHISTLNQFIVATIPVEIIINIPAIAWLFGWRPSLSVFHPGVCIMKLLSGGENVWPTVVILAAWTAPAVLLSGRAVGKSLRTLGGVKL
jgi:fluoroquinolone transport system permease protein